MKYGIGGRDETVNAAEAKKRWPTHAKAIDQAIAELSTLSPVGYAPRTFSDLIHRKHLKMVRNAYPTTIPTA